MTEKLYSGYYYHIYNRGNNREKVFFLDKNYIYFLEKFDKYLSEYLDVYAFCLLPNHFHFLVKIKENIADITAGNDSITQSDGIDMIVSEKFRRFFIGYSQAINRQEKRTGSLFQKNFKRKHINKTDYLNRLIYYIHLNPALHKISNSYEDYPFSSYRIILCDKQTKLKRNEVLKLFKNKEEFIKFHQMHLADKKGFDDYYLE